MGLSASKRVKQSLGDSPDFNSVCNSVYESSLALAQHTFPGVKPYQLFSAIESLHQTLTRNASIPLITKWFPSPPTREQVDRAFKTILERRRRSEPSQDDESDVVLGNEEFKEFAVEVYADGILSNARNEILKKVPIGLAGIAGVGMIVRPGRELIGTVMGGYALGFATAVYLSLTG